MAWATGKLLWMLLDTSVSTPITSGAEPQGLRNANPPNCIPAQLLRMGRHELGARGEKKPKHLYIFQRLNCSPHSSGAHSSTQDAPERPAPRSRFGWLRAGCPVTVQGWDSLAPKGPSKTKALGFGLLLQPPSSAEMFARASCFCSRIR